MKDIDILVMGEINADLVLTGDVTPAFGQAEKIIDDATLTIGSSGAIFACGAARLGMRVAYSGVVGNDMFGRFMLDSLSDRGVDTGGVHIDPSLITGLSVILSRGNDRAILTHLGAINALRAEQVNHNLLRRARHIHLTSATFPGSRSPRCRRCRCADPESNGWRSRPTPKWPCAGRRCRS